MVSQAKGRIFRRKDGKYLIYIPKALAEDSGFPFKLDEKNPAKKVEIEFFDYGETGKSLTVR